VSKVTQHDMVRLALLEAYQTSKAENPTDPKVAFSIQEIHDAIEAKYGVDWDRTRISNQIQTLRYRNQIEKVGKVPANGRSNRGAYWCTVEIMEAETEPAECIEPESKPEPVEEVVIPEPRMENSPPTMDQSRTDFEANWIPEQPDTPGVYPGSYPEDSDDVRAVHFGGKEAARTHQAFDVANTKRKRKNSVQEEPKSDRQLLHEIMQQLGFIAKEVAAQERLVRESHAQANRAQSAAETVLSRMSAFDKEVGIALSNFIQGNNDRDAFEIQVFKSAFIEGWNSAVRMKATDPKLKSIVEKNIRLERVKCDEHDGSDSFTLIVDGGETEDPLKEIAEDLVKELIDTVQLSALAFNSNNSEEQKMVKLAKIIKLIAERIELSIAAGVFIRTVNAKPRVLPDWAKYIWRIFTGDLGAHTSPEYLTKLKQICTSVEFHEVTGTMGRMRIHLPEVRGIKATMSDFVFIRISEGNYKILPYQMLPPEALIGT
jgi:hypothetical protein